MINFYKSVSINNKMQNFFIMYPILLDYLSNIVNIGKTSNIIPLEKIFAINICYFRAKKQRYS